MTQLWPSLLGAALGFKAFWRWESRNRAGRPKIDRGLRLIQRMSKETRCGRIADPSRLWRWAIANTSG
jgi:hypothetical protein